MLRESAILLQAEADALILQYGKFDLSGGSHHTPMFDKEAIRLKEMNRFVKTVRCIADRIENWGLKHLVICGTLCVCLAISKGRYRQPLLLMILSQPSLRSLHNSRCPWQMAAIRVERACGQGEPSAGAEVEH